MQIPYFWYVSTFSDLNI